MIWELDGTRFDALLLLARSLIYRSYSDYDTDVDREMALRITTAALRAHPNEPDVLAAHAFALQVNGKPIEAYRYADRALSSDPDHAFARIALGLSYGGVGSYDNALREIQQANQGELWQIDSLRALGISYSDLGRYADAKITIEQAIALHPRLLVLYYERALYALQIGDDSAAFEAYFEILGIDPDNIKARLRLCEVSSIVRDRDSALLYCREVTTRAPTWADGWHRLGREYFLQGRYQEAQTALHQCSTLQVLQAVPILERRFECWYLQGQSAEIRGDCVGLWETYNEFRAMAAEAAIPQTWVYPPEGPPGCPNE